MIKYVIPVYCCMIVIHKIIILYWLNYLSVKKVATLVVMKLDILNYGNKVVLTGYLLVISLYLCTFCLYPEKLYDCPQQAKSPCAFGLSELDFTGISL